MRSGRLLLLVTCMVVVFTGGLVSAAWAAGEQPVTLNLVATPGATGRPVALTGALADMQGSGVPSATVTLERSVDGATWVWFGDVETDATGTFSTEYPTTRTTRFRASYAGITDRYHPASATTTAAFEPGISWVQPLPRAASPTTSLTVKWAADVPAHASCVGTLTAYCAGQDQTRTVSARGVYNADLNRMEFTAVVKLSRSGTWTGRVTVGGDTIHGPASLETTQETYVGAIRVGLSANDYSVPCESSVKFTGSLKDDLTGKAVAGEYVRLERWDPSYGWETVRTAKTDSYGKAYFYLHPKYAFQYRMVHPASTRYLENGSRSFGVATYFKVSMSRAGDYSTKRVYLSSGRSARMTVSGYPGRTVRIHNSAHTWSETVPFVSGPYQQYQRVPKTGYYHFKLTRTAPWTVTITLWP